MLERDVLRFLGFERLRLRGKCFGEKKNEADRFLVKRVFLNQLFLNDYDPIL